MDPFSEYSDHDLWSVLKMIHLYQVIESLPGKLDCTVAPSMYMHSSYPSAIIIRIYYLSILSILIIVII